MDNYLSNMISHWNSLKNLEDYYNDERIKAEEAIQHHLQKQNLWVESGTMNFDNLKIRASLRRKWSQRLLGEIKVKNKLTATEFPFLSEYKELKGQSDYLEANKPLIWEKISPALLIYPAKPYFFSPEKGS